MLYYTSVILKEADLYDMLGLEYNTSLAWEVNSLRNMNAKLLPIFRVLRVQIWSMLSTMKGKCNGSVVRKLKLRLTILKKVFQISAAGV